MPHQMMRWRLSTQKVATSLAVKDADFQCPIMEACVHSEPLSIFGGAVDALAQVLFDQGPLEVTMATHKTNKNKNEETTFHTAGVEDHTTPDVLNQALGLTVSNFLPRKCVARVKRSMRRDVQKPVDMKV